MSGAGLRAAPANALALLVLAVALAHGLLALGAWTATGAVPGARELLDPWPLALLAVLGAAALAGLLRRSPPPALALAGLAWSFAVEACTQLPPYPAAEWAGDGPVLIPLHLALGLLTALWALGLPSRGPGAGERACALLILWTTCGFKAYTRTGEAVYALFAAERFSVPAGEVGVVLLYLKDGNVWSDRPDPKAIDGAAESIASSLELMRSLLRDPDANAGVCQDFPLAAERRRCERCSFRELCRDELAASDAGAGAAVAGAVIG